MQKNGQLFRVTKINSNAVRVNIVDRWISQSVTTFSPDWFEDLHYRVYRNLMQRCYYPKHKSYPYYGGRNITVCPEWHDLITFYDWLLTMAGKKGCGWIALITTKDTHPTIADSPQLM